MKLYVPNSIDISSITCVSILDDNTIYLSNNSDNYLLSYNNLVKDYYLTPTYYHDISCNDIELTHDYYYRSDITDILTCTIILSLICFLLPYKIFARFFGRWLKI